jgi:hypothetical protein
MSIKKVMSTDEVGRILGFSSEYVRRQCVSGRMPCTVYRTGSRSIYRITAEGLAEFRRRYSGSPDEMLEK